jgi:hypothetical protein
VEANAATVMGRMKNLFIKAVSVRILESVPGFFFATRTPRHQDAPRVNY